MTLRDDIKNVWVGKCWNALAEFCLSDTMKLIEAEDKRRYGWTEKDCPFVYGEEIEVSDNNIDWHRKTVKLWGYNPEAPCYKYRTSEGFFQYARPIQKQKEYKGVNFTVITQYPIDILQMDVNGKKYKLVEVE